jgi:hypothetical protein
MEALRHTDIRNKAPATYAGKEIFEIKPIALGGSPIDLSNKVVLTREEHIEAVRYWNRVISDLRRGDRGGSPQSHHK